MISGRPRNNYVSLWEIGRKTAAIKRRTFQIGLQYCGLISQRTNGLNCSKLKAIHLNVMIG